MVTRRLLRIKAVQALYAHAQPSGKDLLTAEKDFLYSIQKSYNLYHYLLLLITEISHYGEKRIQISRQKHLPDLSDLNPSTRFVNNEVISFLSENENLQSYIEKYKLTWIEHIPLVKQLYEQLIASEEYKKYISSTTNTLNDSKNILIHLVGNIIAQNDDLTPTLEEQSIFWNDDLDFALAAIVKTIKSYNPANNQSTPLQPLYNYPEDKGFAILLFRKVSQNIEKNKALIQNFTKNWDVERIAYMDIIILMLAITEITEFPTIPIKVTFNEYIEISKYYSTAKSSNFINGVLDKIVNHLSKEKKIVKEGRGLL